MGENGCITKLHHIGFVVNDINRSQAFYEALGFSFHDRWSETPEECALGMGVEGAALELLQMVGYGVMLEFIQYRQSAGSQERPAANLRGIGHTAFEVDDIYAVVRRLEERGMAFVSPVIEHDFAPWIQLTDPDGIRVEFMELRK